jgi:hypothetical protein
MAKPPRQSGKGVTFTPATARRIARAVLAVERGGKDMGPSQLAKGIPEDGSEIVRGTFTAPWSKGSAATVTSAVLSSVTYAGVKNYFATVSGTGTKNCAIAYTGGEWVLIAAEC